MSRKIVGVTVGTTINPKRLGEHIPIMSETTAGIAKVGDNLKIDSAGRLSVDTADEVEGDNTRPITAAAVYSTVGNIEILLGTI